VKKGSIFGEHPSEMLPFDETDRLQGERSATRALQKPDFSLYYLNTGFSKRIIVCFSDFGIARRNGEIEI
jgi:hypothetical protein